LANGVSQDDVYVFSITSVLILGETQSTALNLAGHFSWHTPHWTQRAWSMTWTFFFSPEMALTGQDLAQMPQPTHLSS
jgi:hypothetical protein